MRLSISPCNLSAAPSLPSSNANFGAPFNRIVQIALTALYFVATFLSRTGCYISLLAGGCAVGFAVQQSASRLDAYLWRCRMGSNSPYLPYPASRVLALVMLDVQRTLNIIATLHSLFRPLGARLIAGAVLSGAIWGGLIAKDCHFEKYRWRHSCENRQS